MLDKYDLIWAIHKTLKVFKCEDGEEVKLKVIVDINEKTVMFSVEAEHTTTEFDNLEDAIVEFNKFYKNLTSEEW